MEVQLGPNSVEERNLLYKTRRKLKIFSTSDSFPNRGYELLASSSKYCLVFIIIPDGILSVYDLKQLLNKEVEPLHLEVKLQEKPTHIAVSCDQELLAVTGGQLLCIYKVTDFQKQNVSPSMAIKCDTSPATFVSALQWNPCIPDSIAIAYYDGTLLVSQVSTGQIKKVPSKARCICWSPKGKQLVTGNSDGTLCQYKPDLTPAKLIPAPNLFEGAQPEALAIYWISTFQFAVVYKNATDNSRPAVTVVNTPKAGQPSCTNYEDICYSMGSNRPWFYYLQGLPQWNLILGASSNSMEIATLGSTDGANWSHWCQTDEARPELPLINKKQESYPLGVAIDTCAIDQLPWGENEVLPYMPLLLVVTHTGWFQAYNIINLNKQAPQLCTPPQLITLPAAALTSSIPGETIQAAVPQPVAPPAQIVPPKPQAVPPPVYPTPAPFSAAAAAQVPAPTTTFAKPLAQPAQGLFAVPSPQTEQKQDVKPVLNIPQPQPSMPQHKPQAAQIEPKPAQKPPEVNAAAIAEQDRVNKQKADQELRNMLLKEVNDFQMELYKFVVNTRDGQTKLQRDLEAINANFNYQSMNTEQLKRECSVEELRAAIVQLKLELVRTCAALAEARTHYDAKDIHEWTQVDPLTTKRVASVKKLAYYVQTQLDHAQKALEYKWTEMVARDPYLNKPGQRMIRPILDDIYQPLVKQQEILSRQQAVLRTLRSTFKECDVTPMFKSTSLLRSTPFRNKDPLSKLTKNILNMSIEPETNKKEMLFTPQKLDALRDLLSNHKPHKIKPVAMDLHHHLKAMRLSYQKSVKDNVDEKAMRAPVKPPVVAQTVPPSSTAVKPVPKPDLIAKQLPATFTPVSNVKTSQSAPTNVVRTLFSDEPKQEPTKPVPQMPPAQAQIAKPTPQPSFGMKPQIQPSLPAQPKAQPLPQQPTKPQQFGFAQPNQTVTPATRSVLKDMLQNKQSNLSSPPNVDAKSDTNLFMGQKICSPTALSFAPNTQLPPPSFSSKPISDINNMFSKFTPQTFAPDPKLPTTTPKVKPIETADNESSENKQATKPKEEQPMTNLFGMKPATNSQNVPDVLKSNITFTAVKPEAKPAKAESAVEKVNENVALAPKDLTKSVSEDKENDTKPFGTNKSAFAPPIQSPVAVPIPATIPSETQKPVAEKPKATETKIEAPKPEARKEDEKPDDTANSSASSIFAVAAAASPASKPQSLFGTPPTSPTSTPASIFGSSTPPVTTSTDTVSETPDVAPVTTTSTTSASFLFGSAVASQPAAFGQTTTSGSIFSSTTTTSSSLFGTSTGSIFGTPTTTTTTLSSGFATATTQSVFSTESKPSIFSTPTPASPGSVFGGTPPSTAASQASVFAAATQSVFGTSVFGTPSSTPSAFGTAVTTSASVFGTTATTQSVFGTATATTNASIFGAPAASPSVFGSTTTTQAPSIFGSPGATSSVFGATPATQASVFAATTQTSVFGTATPTQGSIFGSAPQTTQASVFGTTPTTQSSVFGSQPAAGTGIFGESEGNLFAAASISTTSASSPTSGSIFGGGSSGSVFGGGNTNVFGGKSTFSQSNPTAAAIFGGATSFGQKTETPAANFWSGANANAGSGFGSSGFGQQATTQASSIFGGGGSFSTPSAQPFGTPQQQTSVFGSPQQQQGSSPGFGGSAMFGSKPAFGQPSGFGSTTTGGFGSSFGGGFAKSTGGGFGAPAAFGSAASFGGTAFGNTSPGKVFGGSPTSAFGSTQSNATFENLATQNTLTFGNLAQQSPPPAAAPTFNTSPSFTGWRG